MEGLKRLQEEIKRKQNDLKKKDLINEDTRYFKRSKLVEMTDAEYRLKSKQRRRSSTGDDAELDVSQNTNDDDDDEFSEADLFKRFRELGEPIKLFGETLKEARYRLQELELIQSESNQDRQRNELQDAMANVDNQLLEDILGNENDRKKVPPPKYTWEEMQEMSARLGQSDELDATLCRRFFKYLSDFWGYDLDQRPDAVKQSREGRMASAIYTQNVNNMKPLLRLLKKKEVSQDVLYALREISLMILQREYLKAYDAYLRLAIGNAAWPIGVTNVGIHSRTGREKIFSQKIAHVLNDETQRKFIQGLKRFITFTQKRFPNIPSKCVDFKGMSVGLYPVASEMTEEEVEAAVKAEHAKYHERKAKPSKA